jgi:hypothetical protein
VIFNAGDIAMVDFPGVIEIKSCPDTITHSIGLQ